MDVVELIKTRRSIRSFTSDPVSDEVLRQLVDAGCWAPTASNMQAWQFVVVRDKETIKKLQRFSPGLFVAPPALIVIGVDRNRAFAKCGEMGRDLLCVFDACMAAQNIMLLAHSMGLGTCVLRSFDQKAFQIMLDIPEQVTPELVITVGVPKGMPKPPERRPLGEVLHFERWG